MNGVHDLGGYHGFGKIDHVLADGSLLRHPRGVRVQGNRILTIPIAALSKDYDMLLKKG